MNHDNTPTASIPVIPDAALKNLKRSQRIIDAYKQLQAEIAEDVSEGAPERSPTREEVVGLVGGSMRDVQPVLNVHKQLTALQSDFAQVPEVLTMQLLSALNQHFTTSNEAYGTELENKQAVFDNGVAELSTEIGTLEFQADELTHRVLEKDGIIEHLTEDVGALREEVVSWQGKYEAEREQYRSAATELREAKEKSSELTTTINTQKTEHEGALTRAERSHQAQRSELIQQHEKANDVLVVELDGERIERKAERKEFKKQLTDKSSELAEVQQQLVGRNALLRDNQNKARVLADELSVLKGEHSTCLNELRGLQELPNQLEQQKIEIERLSGENEDLKQQALRETVSPEQLKEQLEGMMSAINEKLEQPGKK